MTDPALLARLPAITHPVLVVWGAADGVVAPSHGRACSAAIPGARLDLVEGAGHLPQLETSQRLADDVRAFADEHARNRPAQVPEPRGGVISAMTTAATTAA